jgi:PKD repeat protein
MAYTPDFIVNKSVVVQLETVVFSYTGSTSPAVRSLFWSFGDGGTSTELSPSHYWKNDGIKAVTLTAIYADGTQVMVEKSSIVQVNVGVIEDYIDLLLYQFKQKANWRKLLTPPINQVTLIDFVALTLGQIFSFNVDGVHLDNLGVILGLPRLERSDSDYRAALQQMPEVITGFGQLPILIKYAQLFLGAETLSLFESDKALYLDATNPIPQNYNTFLGRFKQHTAAGTSVALVISDNNEVPLEFEFTDEPADYLTENELSELSYDDDGFLSELY